MPTNNLILKTFTSVCAAALLAGCSIPNLGEKPRLAWSGEFASLASFQAKLGEWPADDWWVSYDDAQLTALIDEALNDSPSLAVAAARLRQADAVVTQANAARLPSVNAKGGTEFTRQHLSVETQPNTISDVLPDDWAMRSNATARIDYQLDFFGRNRASLAAATSRVEAARAEAAAARIELSTAVALAYADFARLHANRAAAAQTVRLREDSLKLSQQRVARGLEDEGQSKQSESQLAQARANLASIDGAIGVSRNQIAALLGKGPDRGLALNTPAQVTLQANGVPANAGLDLVGRRPDLIAARKRAESAAHRIDVARADFYPNVSLSALAGIQTLGIDRLGGGSVSFGQVGPAMTLPIFDGGRIEGAYRQTRGEYDEAVATYNKAVTGALREVADAVTNQQALAAQLSQSRTALAAAEVSYRLARQRYNAGLSSYIDLLVVENALISVQQNVADLEARAFALDVTMVRALGGGFSSPQQVAQGGQP